MNIGLSAVRIPLELELLAHRGQLSFLLGSGLRYTTHIPQEDDLRLAIVHYLVLARSANLENLRQSHPLGRHLQEMHSSYPVRLVDPYSYSLLVW